ncbi:pyridoxamine 5'-phosphate oxidase family protein [Rhizobium glycinendophyticum]|uniref:Pyridoxamine 5'-phosphate oxidase family protein n=1 Tax=Rhizobium glycinendophyticum TaxID=2589807 RepID=A0A504UQS1_9HYPH|nr:pyridoxamine 5'-phosphate oxidase family protein [Rhizobium glycinendophyticum]TPP11166.1 pyridoxamine 5'-phosphate oxidase family protein [Rhizobium glycinendophyticum]
MNDRPDPQSFPVTPRNRAKRLHERAAYDREAVYAVLDAALLCHVAYVIDGQPYCTPTIHWREGDWLFWHGSSASRMLKSQKAGIPVCLTVAHLDGLVLARSGFHHSANYRSAMCFGTAHIIDDPQEKAEALKAVVDRFYPGRTAVLRENDPQEAKGTMVIGMRIEEASAKVRTGGVSDDPADIDARVWAGVIPVETRLRAPEICPKVPEGVTYPEHLAHFQEGRRLDEVLAESQALYEAALDRT